jgi:SulP family sulfate permease
VVFFGRWAALIPLASLAGVLVVVAYNMSEWRLFLRLLRSARSDVAVLLATFALTLLFDLTVAIQVGVVLAALLFMRRMAEITEARHITGVLDDDEADDDPQRLRRRDVPPGIEVFEVNGPFFFGATDKFRSALRRVEEAPTTLVLRLRHVPAIDATGVQALEDILERCRHDGTRLVLSGVNPRCRAVLDRSGFSSRLGPENYAVDVAAALALAQQPGGEHTVAGSSG